MGSNNWKKVENESGYPLYIHESTGKQQYDNPEFLKILEALEEYNQIKYTVYRIAFKIYTLQKFLKVPPLRISSGVFARHQLSLSESSLSLDTAELESVLADIYFAAEKEGHFSGDVDLTVDLMINLLLNVYDKLRKEPVRVLAAKTLLIILSEESPSDKWAALANSCADHNGCVSPKRLTSLLGHVTALAQYLGAGADQLQKDVDSCFSKSAGMLGVSARWVADWAVNSCWSSRWMPVAHRVQASRQVGNATTNCAMCGTQLIQVLTFQCTKCNSTYFCEKCYLYDKDLSTVPGHKKTHVVHEVIDGQSKPQECLSFMKGMRRFFFCTKTKKKKTSKFKRSSDKENAGKRRKDDKLGKPVIFTSTVGKASGNKENNPASMLQDIITQLETQNKALQELSNQLQEHKDTKDDCLKSKVDAHSTQISTQINRLKALKDNLTSQTDIPTQCSKSDKADRPQAFDLFSPIPVVDEKQSKVTDLKNQPRVLSLDSGNFSVVSKHADSQNLLTLSGDALKPVVVQSKSDSISTVSMNDISSWYNDRDSLAPDKRSSHQVSFKAKPQDLAASEIKFAADLRTVANSNDKMKELNADLDTVLDRLHQILANNFAMDDSCFDNTQLRETANEMEGLLGTLIRGVEQRATMNAVRGHV